MISQDTLKRRLIITASDVVIPLQYPVILSNGNKLVRMFIVVSFTDDELKTFPREKLESIIYRNKDELEERLTPETESPKKEDEGDANVIVISIVAPVIAIVVIILVFTALYCYTKRCRQVQENHEEDNGPVAVEREDNGHVAVEREDNGAVAVRRMDDDQYEILLQ